MSTRPVLAAVCGQPPAPIQSKHGVYMDWFRAAFDEAASFEEWDLGQDLSQPDLGAFAGVLITGSPASLTAPEPWMEVAVELIRDASEAGVPVLGVCFGHQLVGCAYGAPTIPAPKPGEYGTHSVVLSDKGRVDPLFEGLPERLDVNFSHSDQVDPMAVSFSNGLEVLGSTENTPVQALAAGDSVRSVQFHPEFTDEIMRSYLNHDGRPQERAQAHPEIDRIFHNWMKHWVDKS